MTLRLAVRQPFSIWRKGGQSLFPADNWKRRLLCGAENYTTTLAFQRSITVAEKMPAARKKMFSIQE